MDTVYQAGFTTAQETILKFEKSVMGAVATAAVLAMGLSACGGGGNAAIPVASADEQAPTAPVATPVPTPTDKPVETPEDIADNGFDSYYNVCRGTDPACYANWNAFTTTPNRVLIYSRTAGPRHANLGTPMGAGLNPVMNPDNLMQAGLKRMMEEAGITADWTEDVAVLASRINNYKTVIFASSNRDTLWNDAVPVGKDAARTALRNYMRRGGGFVGLHNAFGAEYNWPYYEGLLGNANFYNHGPNRAGTVEIVAADPSTEGVDARFAFQDEWYNLTPFPTRVKFLAKVDTSTLSPLTSAPHPGHKDFHPVAWCQYYDGGRSWLTTLGHTGDAFQANSTAPGSAAFQKLVVQGVKSTMGLLPFCTTPAAG